MSEPLAPAFVTIDDAAAYLALNAITLRRAISAGELRAHKFGPAKGLRIRITDLESWTQTKVMPNARSGRRAGASA